MSFSSNCGYVNFFGLTGAVYPQLSPTLCALNEFQTQKRLNHSLGGFNAHDRSQNEGSHTWD